MSLPADTLAPRWGAGPTAGRSDRAFWLGLGAALTVHLFLLVGFATTTVPRRIGDPTGAADGIAVDLVDAASLFGSSAPAEGGAAPPAPSPTPMPRPAAEAPPPAAETSPLREPTREAASPSPPPSATEAIDPDRVAEQQSPSAPRPKEVSPELAPPVENAPERAPRTERERVEPKQPEPKQPEPKQADGLFRLTVPDELPQRQAPAKPRPSPQQQARPKPDEARPRPEKQASAAEQTAGPTYSARAFQGGGAAGVARPPGYTRSGENDDFARRVVAALRQTMPQMNVRGRVTVRLVLNEHGNLAEVKMLANSGDASLAPAVVFSTRQASFPLPPARSLEIDRIFLITYSYH